jgi:hypothetical protein
MGAVLSWVSVNWFALLQTIGIVGGLLLVMVQIRASTRQREMESLVEICGTNRELIGLAFSHPQLFAVLQDAKKTDHVWEQYYLQLWLNQFALTHCYLKQAVLKGEFKENLSRDVADFMSMENMRRHWQRCGKLYPASFQKFVGEILEKVEPPLKAAQVKSK